MNINLWLIPSSYEEMSAIQKQYWALEAEWWALEKYVWGSSYRHALVPRWRRILDIVICPRPPTLGRRLIVET